MIKCITRFEGRLRAVFGTSLFTTIEAKETLGYSFPYTKSIIDDLHQTDRLELIQAGTLSRFNIWRLK